VLGDCNIGEKKEEYLKAEKNSLNSIDEREKARKELAAVVLERCHVE
jgi:hypothetical protein